MLESDSVSNSIAYEVFKVLVRSPIMNCPNCDRKIPYDSNFCPQCGKLLTDKLSNTGISANATGNQVDGALVVGNSGSIVVNLRNEKSENAQIKAEPKWRSPLTKDVLTWISCIAGVLALFPANSLYHWIVTGSFKSATLKPLILYICVFSVLAFIILGSCRLRTIAKKQLTFPLAFNYGISGVGEHLSLIKLKSKCPICKGNLRYKKYEYDSHYEYYINKRSKKVIDKKKPFVVCSRNDEHRWYVDPAIFYEAL